MEAPATSEDFEMINAEESEPSLIKVESMTVPAEQQMVEEPVPLSDAEKDLISDALAKA